MVKRTGLVTSVEHKHNKTIIMLNPTIERNCAHIELSGTYPLIVGAVYSIEFDGTELKKYTYIDIPNKSEPLDTLLLKEDTLKWELVESIVKALCKDNPIIDEEKLMYALEAVDFDKYL